ncbi:GNAT family N-acetyltransferase [Desulfonatronospira sp.]|uniref:GNAT family N-acetyltransferase n=1 Tax=Desulfonatronospira sp. TaxID=1962951 RepID=UPI0025C314D4|nr:GNAT family N-acetyltransferase [Desulfonatronospira sp.]
MVPDIRKAVASDEEKILDLMVLAFSGDPVLRWSFPDASTYLKVMPGIARFFGGRSLEHGSAYCLEGHSAVVQLLPPGVLPDFEGLFELNQKYVPEHILPDLMAVYEAMEAFHPEVPHWHLAWSAVDPACRGRGYGTALCSFALKECQEDGLPVYLESTSARSIPFYERLGFELLGSIQRGNSPVMYPMLKK